MRNKIVAMGVLLVSSFSLLASCDVGPAISTPNSYPAHDILSSTAEYLNEFDESLASHKTSFTFYRNFSLDAASCQTLLQTSSFSSSYISVKFTINTDFHDVFSVTYSDYATIAAEDSDSVVPCLDIGSAAFAKSNLQQDSAATSLPIDSLTETVTVNSSEELWYWAMKGKKPVVAEGNETLNTLYEKIKTIVKGLIGTGVSDTKTKVAAIYNYLGDNVRYDYTASSVTTKRYEYDSYFLEGVFNSKHALCDGYSKAFVLMCAMEGIDAKRVVGTRNNHSHSWDVVSIDNVYYICDPTANNFSLSLASEANSFEMNNHNFLFAKGTLNVGKTNNTVTVCGDVYSQLSSVEYLTEASYAGLDSYWKNAFAFADGSVNWSTEGEETLKNNLIIAGKALLAEEAGLYSVEIPYASGLYTVWEGLRTTESGFSAISYADNEASNVAYLILDSRINN